MMTSRKKFSFEIFILIICLILPSRSMSASSSGQAANEAFARKYGKKIGRINAGRIQQKEPPQTAAPIPHVAAVDWRDSGRTPPSSREVYDGNSYYAYVDENKFAEDRIPQQFLPTGESYQSSISSAPSRALPDDMFEIVYNTNLYPPFEKFGAEFDAINIPEYDVYGVKTAMSDKTYLLAGNRSLQKNIDRINSSRTKTDVEMSETLIKEQKILQQKQRMIKTFGRASIEIKPDKIKSLPKDKKIAKGDDKKLSMNASDKTSKPQGPDSVVTN